MAQQTLCLKVGFTSRWSSIEELQEIPTPVWTYFLTMLSLCTELNTNEFFNYAIMREGAGRQYSHKQWSKETGQAVELNKQWPASYKCIRLKDFLKG